MRKSSRLVFNRGAVDAVRLGVADGLYDLGHAVVWNARPPDAEPYGVGLITRGGVMAWVDGKIVAREGKDGKAPRKPRALRLARPGITICVGWGFPARFVELGTILHAAQPFLTPAFYAELPSAERYIRPRLKFRLSRIR